MLSFRVSIIDQGHLFQFGLGPSKTDVQRCSPVIICGRTFVGVDTTITKGVTTGSDCVIGANSVVTTNIANGSVVAVNQACLLRNRF